MKIAGAPVSWGVCEVPGWGHQMNGAGYRGWYVMEQDTVPAAEPDPGSGPIDDVRAGLALLRGLA